MIPPQLELVFDADTAAKFEEFHEANHAVTVAELARRFPGALASLAAVDYSGIAAEVEQ